MRKIRNMIYVALVAVVCLLAVAINPLTALYASIGMIAFLAVARQMNFYKIFTMMKNWAKNASRLRVEIRARVHTGFKDYANSLDEEASHSSGRCSYIR